MRSGKQADGFKRWGRCIPVIDGKPDAVPYAGVSHPRPRLHSFTIENQPVQKQLQ